MRAATISRREGVRPSKPEGGYQLIPAVHLALAWWAYRQNLIRLADLRVYFACWEMRARRCRMPSPLPRRFGLDELERLTGLAPRRLRAALYRLEAAKLLCWSEQAVAFPLAAEATAGLDGNDFRRFFDQIPNHNRKVPVPRRILRLLASGCRPALIATVLGHLLRCLYVKGGTFQDVGRVKASWIAEVFGVGLRRVKQARQELVAMGWIVPLPSPQWAMNRWGALVRINLAWSRTGGIEPGSRQPSASGSTAGPGDGRESVAAEGPELAPPAPLSGQGLAPPDSSDEEPLRGDKNQEPAAGGPPGFSLDLPGEKTAEAEAPIPDVAPVTRPAETAARPAPGSTVERPGGSLPRPAAPQKPDLRNVVPEDLADTSRLLDLYAQAVVLGLVAASEWGRLRFVAAAEHARSIGTANPCGLFASLVRGGRLHFATEDDEQAASVRLRRHLHGGAPPGRSPVQGTMVRGLMPELSEDARLVRAVRAAAARAGYRGDPFPFLKREKPEWTRERWDRAVEELEQ